MVSFRERMTNHRIRPIPPGPGLTRLSTGSGPADRWSCLRTAGHPLQRLQLGDDLLVGGAAV